MKTRSRMLALTIVTGAAALVLTACGGSGHKSGTQGQSSDTAPATYPPLPTAAPPASGKALPKVTADQVKDLVGTWKDTAKGPTDTFVFKSDGSGTWAMAGKTLWSGSVIPLGGNVFRLSWEGRDPGTADYWQVQLSGGGKQLTFQGNNQTYTKG